MVSAIRTDLRRQLAAANRRGHLRALILILPLLLFVILTFAVPVVLLLTRAAYDPSIAGALPQAVAALRDWNGKALPDEAAYEALVADFKQVSQDNRAALVGKRLNYEIPGIRSKIISSANKASQIAAPPYKEQLIAADKIWGDTLVWTKIKQA